MTTALDLRFQSQKAGKLKVEELAIKETKTLVLARKPQRLEWKDQEWYQKETSVEKWETRNFRRKVIYRQALKSWIEKYPLMEVGRKVMIKSSKQEGNEEQKER